MEVNFILSFCVDLESPEIQKETLISLIMFNALRFYNFPIEIYESGFNKNVYIVSEPALATQLFTSTDSSITITWTNPTPAPTKYDVMIKTQSATAYTTVASGVLSSATLSTAITSSEFTDIASATTFDCKIVSIFESAGDPSECKNEKTFDCYTGGFLKLPSF